MKKILYSIIAGLVLASCGSMVPTANNSAANTTTPTTNTSKEETATNNNIEESSNAESFAAGQQSGVALKALYDQYKVDGKLDFSNLTNVANIMNIAAQAQKIKDAEKGSVNYSEFSKGLIVGSTNLITDINVDQVVGALKETVSDKIDTEKITEATDKTQTAVSNISQAAGSITDIINLFKK
jgi:hypothetical protein